MKNSITILVSVFVLSSLHGLASSQSIIKAELFASRDNSLYQDTGGTTSNGAGDYLFVGKTRQGSIRRAYIYFDVAAQVPKEAIIDSVRLSLNMSKTTADSIKISLHRVLADWGEGTSNAANEEGSGAAAKPGDATWVYSFYNTTKWQSPGGDFAIGASESRKVAGLGFYSWGSTPAMVADVQLWLTQPVQNFGWMLLGNESLNSSAKRFDSRENSLMSARPKLLVYYQFPVSVSARELQQPTWMELGNYPNPFNSATTIAYSMQTSGHVMVRIFNLFGEEIQTIEDGSKVAGSYTAVWDGKDLKGMDVTSGAYIVWLNAPGMFKAQRLLLVR